MRSVVSNGRQHPYPDFFGTAYPDFPSDPNKCWAKNLFGPCGKRLGRSPHRTQLAQKSRFPHNSETGRKAPPPPTRGVQTGPARALRPVNTERAEIVFKVDAPRGGTRAQASRVPPPPSDAEPPPSSPMRASSLARVASLTHATSPLSAISPSSAASTAQKSAAHVFPHPSTIRRAAAR